MKGLWSLSAVGVVLSTACAIALSLAAETEPRPVKVDAEALARAIERDGHVVLEGIYFDTDHATLKPESKPALEEIAKMMKDRPNLKVWVVGHTDSRGDVEANKKLSRAWARAVLLELVGTYGIDVGRMRSHGVGPLVPATTNRDDAGRAKNRRVELVEQ